jgi:hypothetical protein
MGEVDEQRSSLQQRAGGDRRAEVREVSTSRFDWITVVIGLLLTAGLCWDGWSHTTFGPDQKVFSRYHILFYSSFLALAIWLLANARAGTRRGAPWARSLPLGYGPSLLGIPVFLVAGVLDLTGHYLYGFENGVAALLSPTHVGIFIGWTLIVSGPVLAGVARLRRNTPTALGPSLPMLISLALVLVAVSFAAGLYLPIGGPVYALAPLTTAANSGEPVNPFFAPQLAEIIGITGLLLQTIILMAALLWLMNRVRLPWGSLTVVLTVYGLLISFMQASRAPYPFWLLPAIVLTGLGADLLYGALQPYPGRIRDQRLFAFLVPILLWSLFYLEVSTMGGGLIWESLIWIGSIFQAGLASLLLTVAMTPPAEGADLSPGMGSSDDLTRGARATR